MESSVTQKIQILFRQYFLFVTLFLLHQGAVAAVAAEGKGQLTACEETPWVTFSRHDLELVEQEHENATVLLQAWGSFSQCLNVSFRYNPASPTIEPLDGFILCPNHLTSTLSLSITSLVKPLPTLPLASKLSSPSPSNSLPSASPPLPPPHPSSSFTAPKRCTGCEDGPLETSEAHPVSSHTDPQTSFLPLQERSRVGRLSSSKDMIANVSVEIVSRRLGRTVVEVTTNSSCVEVTDAFVRVSVIHTRSLQVVADVLGWIYTVLWDVSFFPQMWLNWRRKSVEGLSLDHVTLNVFAYLYYSLFNVAFYYIPLMQEQFKERYPRSVNHVRHNDVFFATYAFVMEIVVVIQCCIYGRNKGLYVSWPCLALLALSVLALGVECVLVTVGVLWWLDVFYLMSYIKLAIAPLTYIPQVYVNYQRRSTEGFSIHGVALDFMGGLLSLLQMFLLSANSNDFVSIFTDFSKFGLGAISLIFDIIMFFQHWYYDLRQKNCNLDCLEEKDEPEGRSKERRSLMTSLMSCSPAMARVAD